MKILTVKEVSDFLKAKPSTIYSWSEQGTIPSFKINGLLRFDEDAVLSWVKNQADNGYNINTGRRPKKGGRSNNGPV